MHDLILDAVSRGGYFGIFLLMALENIIPPIPSEVILGIAGVLVARGELAYWPLVAIATLGTTAGNCFWYWIGHKFGYERLAPFIARHGRWFTVTFEEVEKSAEFFNRHGHWVIFFLRFSPILRTIVSLPAGLSHMPLGKFLTFTFAGSLIWNALLVQGGRWLAPLIERYEGTASLIIVGSVALMLAYYLYRVATWKPRED